MTLIGKLLVFLNLVVSMAFLTWSVGIYVERPDWFEATNEAGEKAPGRFARLKDEVTRLASAADANAKRWAAANRNLETQEAARENRRQQAAKFLAVAREPEDKTAPAFFTFPAYVPGRPGLIDLGNPGPPEKGPDNRPLRGADTLLAEFETNSRAIQQYADESLKLRVEGEQLGKDIVSADAQYVRHLAIKENVQNELEYLGSFRINWTAQQETVTRRKDQLERRLAEFGPRK